MAVAEPGAGLGLAVELAVELAVVAWRWPGWRWVDANGAGLSPGLAPGLAVELAVELALGCFPTLVLGARPLVVVVVMVRVAARVMVKRWRLMVVMVVLARVMASVDAVAQVRWNHFHCLKFCQRLESTPLRLDARFLDLYTSRT